MTNMEVNYGPNGWATHKDGTPVQTIMTLQMKEIELITANEVNIQGGGF